jgi:hypothetical protein
MRRKAKGGSLRPTIQKLARQALAGSKRAVLDLASFALIFEEAAHAGAKRKK